MNADAGPLPVSAVRTFFGALRTALPQGAAGEPGAEAMAAAIAARLGLLPPPESLAAPASVPAARHLPEALAGRDPLTRSLARILPSLSWRRTYAGAPGLEEFLEGYGYAELVGPGGPVRAPDLRLGVLLLGPGVLYPPHRHPAEELYLVVSGTALWKRGGGRFLARPPGSAVHHPPEEPHAMRAQGEPLLAVYAWTGDVETPARLLEAGA
jgi:mannose-6-phosphate isomerase-like protein (cupin superfamily)